jgi:histidyl-tRNA synthetase
MKHRYQAPRGTRDILPGEVASWRYLERTTREIFGRYGFREIRTPIFESTQLFARSVGESSDIVTKEMYTFQRGDESMTLRPENTAPVVRAAIEHTLHRQVGAGYPERLFYIGPMFRYERPQKGRQRQFHQVGVEVLGASEPLADAETIQMVGCYLDALGIEDRELKLGSVGDATCRPRYRERLQAWLEPRLGQLCADCNRRYSENPLRVFDCKVEADRQLLAQAPSLHDTLCDPCRAHFNEVESWLERFGVAYTIEDRLVRGLDYYQRTVFEVTAGGLGAQNAVLGGGRYDGLMQELGGPAIPGVGFAMGMERVLMLLPSDRVPPERVDAAVVGMGPEGWEAAAKLAQRLRNAGFSVLFPLVERPMGPQLKRADRERARFAVFVGRDELAAGLFGVKDLDSGEQTALDESGLVNAMRGAHVR